LQRIDELKLDFAIPEKYASRVTTGSKISFSISGRDGDYSGDIYALEPRIDTITRTFLIRARCPNPRRELLPGSFASVKLVLEVLQDAVLVPSVAVIAGLDEKIVFIVQDGKAVRRPVAIGMRTATSVQVLAGLKKGDVVVTSGLQQMREGTPVLTHSDATQTVTSVGSKAERT
jgi:membrane fusion protein, multidrug efflux system